jgi:hypothetical protein
VVEGLLHEDGDASKQALEGLSEDRIERLEGIGEAGSEEDIAHSDEFHLFNRVSCICSFVNKPWKIPHHICQHFQHGSSVEDLNRKRHVHDGLSSHQIGPHLLQDHL